MMAVLLKTDKVCDTNVYNFLISHRDDYFKCREMARSHLKKMKNPILQHSDLMVGNREEILMTLKNYVENDAVGTECHSANAVDHENDAPDCAKSERCTSARCGAGVTDMVNAENGGNVSTKSAAPPLFSSSG